MSARYTYFMLDWRVFGQCEEGGDHLSRRFLSETTETLNRIPSAGALGDIRYSPPRHRAFFFAPGLTDRPTTDPAAPNNSLGE